MAKIKNIITAQNSTRYKRINGLNGPNGPDGPNGPNGPPAFNTFNGFICIGYMTFCLLLVLIILCVYIIVKFTNNGNNGNIGSNIPMNTANKLEVLVNTNTSTSYEDNGRPPTNNLTGILPLSLPLGPMAAMTPPCTATTRNNYSNNSSFTQIGILNGPVGSHGEILPLMARRISRNQWQYYTVSDNTMHLKIPLRINNRDGMDQYGCQELSSDDMVNVNEKKYKVTLYDNTTLRYL